MIIKKFFELESTNKEAKQMAEKGLGSWTVVSAKKQSAGYGKENVGWFSPEGGLYFSIILPKSQIEDLQTLTVLAAFIVASTIKDKFGLEPLIKLPNDVLIKDKKVAGILTENIIGKDVKLSVIGIGINTNTKSFPQELANIATSLKMELGREVGSEDILKEVVEGLKKQLKTISG